MRTGIYGTFFIISTLAASLSSEIVAEANQQNLRTLKAKGAKTPKGKTSTKAPKATKTPKNKATKAPKAPKSPKTASLTILHINDHHSHLEQENFDLRGDSVPPSLAASVDRLRVYYGGFPRLVSLVKKIEEEEENPILKIHAGDAVTGTSFYSLFKGNADAAMMNRICFDAFCLGNHEFDNGDQTLSDFITTLNSESEICPNTSVLSANLVPGDTSPLKTLMDNGTIQPSMMKTLPGGQKVGIVGINIKDKTINSSNPDEGTTYTDEKEAAEAEVKNLKDAGASIIILVTHIGLSNDMEWMTNIDGVDVVIGGDSHTLMGDAADLSIIRTPTASYPTIYDNGGKKVCVVHAWEYSHGLGKLRVSFDENGDVASCDGGIVFPFDGETFTVKTDPDDYDLSSEQAAEVSTYLAGLGSHMVAVKDDAETATKLGEFSSQVDEQKKEIIATVPEDICHGFPFSSAICQNSATAAQGGSVCNIVSKAFLDQVKTADIAINNGGGCRSDIVAGDFSINSAYTLLPFSNTLVNIAMTGAEIVVVLEQAIQYALTAAPGAYPYASGLRYDIDATKAQGERFSSVEVNSRGAGVWTAIEADKVYVVATNSYIGTGRDGYLLFGEKEESNTYLEYAQTFIDYCVEVGTIVNLPAEEYSTQSVIFPPVA